MMLGVEGQPTVEREQQDRPPRAPRREGHLDPVLRARGPADRVARPADRRRDLAVPARRGVGRAGLPRHRPAAGHLGRPAHAGPGGADQRHGARHDAPGRRAGRRGQGARDAPAPERPDHRHRREHERVRLPALRRGDRDLRPRRRRAVRAAARARLPGQDPARRHRPPGRRRRRAGGGPARAGCGRGGPRGARRTGRRAHEHPRPSRRRRRSCPSPRPVRQAFAAGGSRAGRTIWP